MKCSSEIVLAVCRNRFEISDLFSAVNFFFFLSLRLEETAQKVILKKDKDEDTNANGAAAALRCHRRTCLLQPGSYFGSLAHIFLSYKNDLKRTLANRSVATTFFIFRLVL